MGAIYRCARIATRRFREIRDHLEENEDKFFELRDGLTYRKHKRGLLFYIPESMESSVIRSSHDELGHWAIEKIDDDIMKMYWLPRMRDKVKTYIPNFLKCVEYAPHSGKS